MNLTGEITAANGMHMQTVGAKIGPESWMKGRCFGVEMGMKRGDFGTQMADKKGGYVC